MTESSAFHESAIIHPNAKIGNHVEIGPWTIIGEHVEIGDECSIGPHVVLKGPTRLGRGNKIYSFCSIGEDCQDKKYAGEPTQLEIGDYNIFRESCTVHRGTVQDKGKTQIGNHNLFMVNVHVAHDCLLGDHSVFANNATLAGHVKIGDSVIFGGHAAIHQFGCVGSYAFIAGCSALNKDVPPYVMAAGHYAKPFGVNVEGLRRNGFTDTEIANIRKAYRLLYRESLPLKTATAHLQDMAQTVKEIEIFAHFLEAHQRTLIR